MKYSATVANVITHFICLYEHFIITSKFDFIKDQFYEM